MRVTLNLVPEEAAENQLLMEPPPGLQLRQALHGRSKAEGALESPTMFNYDRLDQMLDRVRELREPELVLLNGHLLIERMMTEVAAVRLRCADTDVPRLSFRSLMQLAFRNETTAKPVTWLNEMRNAMSHQFNALESEQFAELVARFHFPWPAGALDRATVLQLIVYDAESVLFRRMLEEIERDAEPYFIDWDEDQHQNLIETANLASEMVMGARQLIAAGSWDSVVNILKPGWKGLGPSSSPP
jgi:hypothetical protein